MWTTGGSASLGVRHTPTHSALPNWREPVAHPLTTRASSNLGFRVINPLAPNLGGNAPRAQATFPKFWTTRLAAVFVGSAPYRGRLELSAIQVARLKKPLAQELEPGARRCKHVALRAPWPDRASFKLPFLLLPRTCLSRCLETVDSVYG